MAGQVYFGNTNYQTFIPSPQTGMEAGAEGYVSEVPFLNGRAFVKRSRASHRVFNPSWLGSVNNPTLANGLQVIKNFQDGVYGDGPFYWTDPYASEQNILPPHFAMPALTEKDWPSHFKATPNTAPTVINGDMNGNITGWTGWFTSATVYSTAAFSSSPGSLLATANGSSTFGIDANANIPIIGGVSYSLNFKVRTIASNASFTAVMKYYDSTGANISNTTGTSRLATTASFSDVNMTDTAPANAASVLIGIRSVATPSAGFQTYFDDVTLIESYVTTAFTSASDNGYDWPIKAITFVPNVDLEGNKVRIIIPPTKTLKFGWSANGGVTNASTGVGYRIAAYTSATATPVIFNPNSINVPTFGTGKFTFVDAANTIAGISGATYKFVDIYIYVNKNTNLTAQTVHAAIAQLIDTTGGSVSSGGFSQGKGTEGLEFSSFSSIQYYSSAVNNGQAGLSVKLTEVD